MTRKLRRLVSVCFIFLIVTIAAQWHTMARATTETIRVPVNPTVSPNGKTIAFGWLGEIWSADIDGENLTRLTHHDGSDSQPLFSPDGERLAFVSNRTGSDQIFLMDADGSTPRQITYHSAGYALADWYPDGNSLLAIGTRDHFHRDASRLIKIRVQRREAEQVLVDAMVENAKLSPDGTQVLFTREGERWWRKGYQGERSSQVWLLDLETNQFTQLLHEGVECMWPIWMANGKGFYFTKGQLHGFELWQYRFSKNDKTLAKQKKIHGFEDDSIVFPAISRDGKTILFRHLFDLYSLKPGTGKQPRKIELNVDEDIDLPDDRMRREFSRANRAAFTKDGLEIAFTAGGDVWIMDTKFREPKQVTATDGYVDEVLFSPDEETIWFTMVIEGQSDIWTATRKDDERYWWQNTEFDLQQVTNDAHVESDLKFASDGKHLVLQQGRGDLVVMNPATAEKRKLVSGFSGIDYDLSSDGRWIAYSQQDNDFNSEIWIAPLDGSSKAVNVSRHPDNDGGPKFSPDGKLLAFTSRRIDREVDIYYVYLQEEADEETSRERRLEDAIELMEKKRKEKERNGKTPPDDTKADVEKNGSERKPKDADDENDKEQVEEDDDTGQPDPIEIDFDGIHERLRKISIRNSSESGLVFSPKGKKLAFNASVDGKRGWYTVEFPDKLTPKFLTASTGSNPVWSEKAGGILFLRSGVPTKLETNGKLESYSLEVAQETSRSGWLQAGFEKAWLTMREAWYDERFANHNWDEIRRKYAPVAAQMRDTRGLAEVVQLMLGELNGSHLGFSPSGTFGSSRAQVEGWRDRTAHLGVRFDDAHNGPGLLVRDVIKNGPADRESSKMLPGDVILAIDGNAVDPAIDLTTILNGRLDRDIHIQVLRKEGDGDNKEEEGSMEFELVLRPASYARVRSLLYQQWLDHNQAVADQSSGGKLGYLHIRAMSMGSFYEFERQLYNVGYGREGLVIDVRDNGGGSTTDLLLTALTQPRHAITVPRGGGQGYPHDRAVFASWSKPIVVLCNQNSYSNAEIFSHAVKTLGRGKVIGVQTAGGVISTGSASINDVGRIRVPFRGWFLLDDGQDMERNGCQPDETIWPLPGELPQGVDRQLAKAIDVLLTEVGDGTDDKQLTYAAERDQE